MDKLLRLCVVVEVKHNLQPTHKFSEAQLPAGRPARVIGEVPLALRTRPFPSHLLDKPDFPVRS